MPILAWNVPLISPVLLKKSLVSHSVVSSTSLHYSSKKAFLPLLGILWNSAFCWVYRSLSPLLFTLFFSQLFVKPPQTTILPSCISFSLGWFWSLPPGQCFYIYLFTVMESVPSFPHFILFIFYLSICTHKFIFFLSVILFILMLKLSQSWP